MNDPNDAIQHIIHDLLAKRCKPAFASLFDLKKLTDFPFYRFDMQLGRLKMQIENLGNDDIEAVENLFNFSKSELNLSPYTKNKASIRNTCIPRVLFSILKEDGDFWLLSNLNLRKCHEIPPEQIVLIVNQCKNLHEINLSGCKQLTDAHFDQMTFPQSLTGLYLSDLTISGNRITEVVLRHPDATELDLSYNRKNFETGHLEQIMKAVPHLRMLSLSGLATIEGLAIVQFIKQHPELKKISANNCRGLRSSNIAQLKDCAPYLREFSFKGSEKNPLIFDFQSLIEFINQHAYLEKVNAEHWILNAKGLEDAILLCSDDREIKTRLRISRKQIQFPSRLNPEEAQEKLNNLVAELKQKKILILL